jgi:hypothetical protein
MVKLGLRTVEDCHHHYFVSGAVFIVGLLVFGCFVMAMKE